VNVDALRVGQTVKVRTLPGIAGVVTDIDRTTARVQLGDIPGDTSAWFVADVLEPIEQQSIWNSR
jgi:preprotein translocase subunit YajC